MLLREFFESSENEVAIIFGRFNPPHKGHRAAWELAAKSPAWYVGTNKSTVGPKDPLPYEVKVQAMEAIWPDVAKHLIAETSWLTMASMVYKKHGKINLKCLTDEDWVTKAIMQYNGKEGPHGFYDFPNIEQVPTPRLSSATALRDAVMKGDRKAFSDAAGVSSETKIAGKPFFDLVAEYLLPYADAAAKKGKKVKEAGDNISPVGGKRGSNAADVWGNYASTQDTFRASRGTIEEARKTPWQKMAGAFKGTSKDLDKSEERAQAAIAGIKKASSDYQAIVDKDKKSKDVDESLDASYKFKYVGKEFDNMYTYTFKPKGGSKISVTIFHEGSTGHVTFQRVKDEEEKMTGEHPTTAAKVLGTVRHIVAYHMKKFPEIKTIKFEADKKEPSRVRAYNTLAKRFGGNADMKDKRYASYEFPNAAVAEGIQIPTHRTKDDLGDENGKLLLPKGSEMRRIGSKLYVHIVKGKPKDLYNIEKHLVDPIETSEDAAGVGIITKQNSTADVNKNTPRNNLKAFKL